MITTSRLGLDVPESSDNVSAYPADAAQSLAILDDACLFQSGALSARPAASTMPGSEYYATDVGELAKSNGSSWDAIYRSGDLKYGASSTAPSGYLLCDGSAVSRTTHAALFTNIGTANGAGDGTTTFNLPDYRSRVILGAGQGSGLTNRALGATGGEETHELSQAELPSYDLPASWSGGQGPAVIGSSGSYAVYPPGGGGFALIEPESITTSSGGSNTPHNNMQPFGVGSVYIKT